MNKPKFKMGDPVIHTFGGATVAGRITEIMKETNWISYCIIASGLSLWVSEESLQLNIAKIRKDKIKSFLGSDV
jgi:hypothetical protein